MRKNLPTVSENEILKNEWDESNILSPEQVSQGSSKDIVWRCSKNSTHVWTATVKSRARNNTSCPDCLGRRPSKTRNLAIIYPNIANEWDHTKNSLSPSEVTPYSDREAFWICSTCSYGWKTKISHRTGERKRGCPSCAGRKKQGIFEEYPELKKLIDINSNSPDVFKITSGSEKLIAWKCNKNHQYRATPSLQIKYRDCLVCLGVKKYNYLEQYPEVLAEWDIGKNGQPGNKVSSHASIKYHWKCKNGHNYEALVYNKTRKNKPYGCPKCHTTISKPQQELYDLVCNYFPETIMNYKLKNQAEIDIFIPTLNIGIEFNGLYWHSEIHKDKNYHYEKYAQAKKENIQLIQVWEDDWRQRKDIVTQMIIYKTGLSTKITKPARLLKYLEVNFFEAQVFLEANHIQGAAKGSSYIALVDNIHNKEIYALAVLTYFEKTDTVRIERYATKGVIPGGFSKILKNYERKNPGGDKIWETFSDNALSDGNLYSSNGFSLNKEIKPDYSYIVKGSRVHKFNYRLKKFRDDKKLYYCEGLSESKLAEINNLVKIYDAGKKKWIKNFSL